MPAYSEKPLWMKPGIKEDSSIVIRNTTQYAIPDYTAGLDFPVNIKTDYMDEVDMVHLFVDTKMNLQFEIDMAIKKIKRNGSIWISWPKKSSKKVTDLTEDSIREVVLPIGLVDVKVCSVSDDIWSGLKTVIRKVNR